MGKYCNETGERERHEQIELDFFGHVLLLSAVRRSHRRSYADTPWHRIDEECILPAAVRRRVRRAERPVSAILPADERGMSLAFD